MGSRSRNSWFLQCTSFPLCAVGKVHLQYGRKCEGDRGGFHITVAFFADDEIACQQYDAEVCGTWFRAYSSTTEVRHNPRCIGEGAVTQGQPPLSRCYEPACSRIQRDGEAERCGAVESKHK